MKHSIFKNFIVTTTVFSIIGATYSFANSGEYMFDLPAGYAIDVRGNDTSLGAVASMFLDWY